MINLKLCASVSRIATACSAALLVSFSAHSSPLALQDTPLYLLSTADPNVLINMSVETPMGGAAYTDHVGLPTGCTGRVSVSGNNDVGTCYFPTAEYKGYFDPNKCYTYDTATTQFNPSAAAGTNHTCSNAWSGNFVNWMSMTAIDMFVWTMTGGNRIVDSTSETVVRRASKTHNDSWFPLKAIGSSVPGGTSPNPSTVTPYSDSTLFFYNTDFGFNVGTSAGDTRNGSGSGFHAEFITALRVCASGFTPESNCASYGAYSKPEGLIQRDIMKKRFGAIGYSMDSAETRHGGVLRANVKYLGPRLPSGATNSAAEVNADGTLVSNPDGASGGLNSGVINYINKFSDRGYKSHDPVGELFYESIRYFANAGPTAEYSAGLTTGQLGGFHIPTWNDPQQYACQKNFIVAINDANPWLDKRLPGTFFTTDRITGTAGAIMLDGEDYGEPSDPLDGLNVRTETNEVGRLEGLNGATWTSTGTWTSGTASGTNDSVGGGNGTFDNSCTDKAVANLGEVMGTCPYPGKQNSYYVAGMAYWANTHDLRPGTDPRVRDDYGIQNVKSFFIDTQEYSTNPLDGPKNMLWLAGKYGGFTDGVDEKDPFTFGAGDIWDENNDGVPDNYVLATQPQNLVSGLNRAFQFIDEKTSSASSAAINSGTYTSGSRIYQTRFNSADWTGQLLAFRINPDGTLGTAPNDGDLSDDEAEWDAATAPGTPPTIPKVANPTSRQIITRDSTGQAVSFTWGSFSGAGGDLVGQSQLHATNPTIAQAVLNYIRGDGSNEIPNGLQFRSRTTKLGDIVSSAPVFVGAPSFRYRFDNYATFASTSGQANRTRMIYVGSNDGMLHGFNQNGVEVFAYIPQAVFPRLKNLASPAYSHEYFVDGSPSMGDAYFTRGGTTSWHTVLVGGLNKGGKAVYALDITNPSTLATAESNPNAVALWEYTDTDLGYTFSQPTIAKLRNGRWAAIFGNGYNSSENPSSNGNAILYIVDLADGTLIRKLDTGVGNDDRSAAGVAYDNGLSTPAVVDINADRIADYVYAGDLFGNMWKFDLTSTSDSAWDVAYAGEPLFTAADASGNRQPITVRPEVTRGPAGAGMVVLFGTGKYLENADVLSTPTRVQSFYGIIDPNTGVAATDRVTDRADLTQQTIDAEGAFDPADPDGAAGPLPDPDPVNVRVTSENTIGPSGWYLDLLSPAGYQNEKQVTNPIVRNGNVIFTTAIPTLNPCEPGGRSWIMEMSALTGARLPVPPFDVNHDGQFDDNDRVAIDTDGDGTADVIGNVSGRAGDDLMGLLQSPGVIDAEPQPGRPVQFKYSPGSSGGIQSITENPGAGAAGRQSWRQIR